MEKSHSLQVGYSNQCCARLILTGLTNSKVFLSLTAKLTSFKLCLAGSSPGISLLSQAKLLYEMKPLVINSYFKLLCFVFGDSK